MTKKTGGQFGYERELTGHLADLMRMWMSPRFRDALLGLSRTGCNETDARVIWELGYTSPRRPGSLADDLSLGAAALTKSVNRLTALGLVEAVSDPSDQRARLVNLTDEGRKVAAQLFRIGDYMTETITDGWSEEELALLTDLLARFSEQSSRFGRQLSER
ncbi:DNA-binding MarR family transcriptional regulator [Rhizobium aquaticum]|uniref:DNA-binding MarR family transcriptional regulator n=1 Tax=Rhizobium aquaticum TaxID=1549636 RepID=A0ABV2IVM8_9HYPH